MKLPTFLILLSAAAHAGPRASASYSITTDTLDSGGGRATSASYTHDGSIGGIVGISTVAVPSETVKHGYIGQLYDVTGLVLGASPATVNEGGTLPLSAAQLLDDATTLAVPATSVAWSVVAGPLTSIDTAGLATAGLVYQNTAATAQGIHLGFTATLGLTVLDALPDNFGSYAGDGLADHWQVQYFGQNNPNAGPALDPDGDGQNNRFEYIAGLVPTNSLSRFLLRVEPVAGFPAKKDLIFSPIVAGRTYSVVSGTALAGWTALAGTEESNAGDQRTITDTAAAGGKKFYRVDIAKP